MTQPVVAVQHVAMPPAAQASARPPCVLPNDMNFTPSINGRNGWDFENFYEISAEVSMNTKCVVKLPINQLS
jgi:hypothetical protein